MMRGEFELLVGADPADDPRWLWLREGLPLPLSARRGSRA